MNINISHWKYIFCVPLLVAFIVIVSTFSNVLEKYSISTATEVGVKNLDQIRAIRNFYADHILTEALDAGLSTDTEHRDSYGTVPAPATFLHDLSEIITETGTEANLYSPYPWPNRAGRILDERQQKAWDMLSGNPDAIYTEFSKNDNNERIVYVGYADRLSSPLCVDCHNNHPDTPITGWSLDDPRGVLEVAVNVEGIMQRGETIGFGFSGVIALLVILSLFMGFGIDRTIGRPLVIISRHALKMLDGEVVRNIPYSNRKDEMGVLARALEQLTNYVEEHERILTLEAQEAKAQSTRSIRLESLLTDFDNRINKTSHEIDNYIKIIYDVAVNLTSNSSETSSQIIAISGSTDEMNRNIQSVSKSGQELSETISTVLEQVTKSRDIARSASTQADEANVKIKGLADAAQRIGEVVDLINDIANQTNLLALNATIEAARAGEAGKGFAVVAGEVKNLANQTAKATEEISSQIHNIQTETNDAVTSIAEVTAVVSNINALSSDIASAIDTQNQAVQEISNNAEETAKGTLNVLEGLTSVSNAATGTGDMAKILLLDTEKLNELSNDLSEEITKFHDGVIEIEKLIQEEKESESRKMEEMNRMGNHQNGSHDSVIDEQLHAEQKLRHDINSVTDINDVEAHAIQQPTILEDDIDASLTEFDKDKDDGEKK
ncbi:MAG: methyl-accepting chemotaxis protein [Alphaproteobacteria bacterium]|nr:methyl-accepting chemotaxis protein [Alphaproteobacteria bacterium]